MSIRVRLALLFSVSVLLLLVGGGVLFLSGLRTGLERSLTMTLVARADNLTGRLAAARAPLTEAYLRRSRLQRSLNGTYAELLSPDGQVIGNSARVLDRPLLTPQQAQVAVHRRIVLDESVHLTGPGESAPEPMRVLAERIAPSGDILVVALSRDLTDTAVARTRDQYLLLGACVLLLAGPGAWLLTRAALRPVDRMRREVGELHACNAGTGLRVPHTNDEIARLAETFNALLARLHAAITREQALVADAGHELRTPLTVLKGELELAGRPNRSPEQLSETIAVAAEETDRLVRLTDDLLFLSAEDVDGTRGFPVEEHDVVAVAQRAARTLSLRADRRGVRIEVDAPGPVTCRANAGWIRRAVDNLLVNALRHSPAGGRITVRVRADGPDVEVVVVDDGPGFPPDFLPNAFHRFARADDSRMRADDDEVGSPGTGLGLAIVASIAARHGGRAWADNRPEGGAVVGMRWPCGITGPGTTGNGLAVSDEPGIGGDYAAGRDRSAAASPRA